MFATGNSLLFINLFRMRLSRSSEQQPIWTCSSAVMAICRYTELNSRCTCTAPVGWPLAISELSGDDRIFSRRYHIVGTKYLLGNLPEIYMSLPGSGSRYNLRCVEFNWFLLKNRNRTIASVSRLSHFR